MIDLLSFKTSLTPALEEAILDIKESEDHILIEIVPTAIVMMVTHLGSKKGFSFSTLIDITAVDFPAKEQRFEVIYHFLSFKWNVRLRIKTEINENGSLPSICSIFPAANWFEREAFDMYGIQFNDHPDLRRILTDYGFEGYPLRKDFPLTGNIEIRYDEMDKKIVYEPVKLQQDYRSFDIQSPWEGTKYLKDEKSK